MRRGALILNSRQSLYPHGGLPWVKQTIEAIDWVAQSGLSLIVTTGSPTWEMLLCLAGRLRLQLHFIQDDASSLTLDEIIERYGLDKQLIQLTSLKTTDENDSAEVLHLYMMAHADVVLPVSIRPNGMLTRLLTTSDFHEKIDSQFEVQHTIAVNRPNRYLFSTQASKLPFHPHEYLFHWTRTSRQGWPGMSLPEYYESLISAESYPFAAFDTLRQILDEKVLRASDRHMPAGSRVVSFTGVPPFEMIPFMRWRRRYREMSFEPYGIGIHRRWAEAHGVRRVLYEPGRIQKSSKTDDRWLRQGEGQDARWVPEDEYRAQGDFPLLTKSPELVVITYYSHEASELRDNFDVDCGWFMES